MKKKLFKIIFTLIIFFISISNINALETNKILNVYPVQNDEILRKEENTYQVDEISEINLKYEISSSTIKKDKYYELYIKNVDKENGGMSFSFSGERVLDNPNSLEGSWDINLNIDKDITTFIAALYESDEEDSYSEDKVLLEEQTINLKFNKFDEVDFANTKLNIIEVTQAGNIIEPVTKRNEKYYYVNDTQEYQVKLKGENFKEELEYMIINEHFNTKKYTGKELNEGLTITIRNNNYYDKNVYYNFSSHFGLNEYLMKQEMTYNDNGNYMHVWILNQNNSNISNFSTNLSYTNFKNVEANWIINGKYHNKDNSLTLNIDGTNFNNEKKYDIEVVILENKQEVYSKSITNINGDLLNNGYSVELDGFVSELSESIAGAYNPYEVYTKINYTTQGTMYYYREEIAYLNTSLFYSNGQRNISPVAGSGEEMGSLALFRVNSDLLIKEPNMYIHVLGQDFYDKEDYEYVVYYCNDRPYGSGYESCQEVIIEGQIKGKDLNKKGVMLKLDDIDENLGYKYILAIKREYKIVQFHQIGFEFKTGSMLSSATLKNDKRNLYIDMRDFYYDYIITKDSKINIALQGTGYDNNKNYNFDLTLCYNVPETNSGGTTSHQECDASKKYTLNGKDLNDGKAVIQYNEPIDYSYKYYHFDIIDENGNHNFINLNFVDSNKYFPKDKKFIIDNENYLIKSIKSKTSVNEISINEELESNEKVKVYDKTGKAEEKKYIGTGMIVRVTDEYDRSLLDMEAVVKGDVTGDGKISVTDLVNVKQHLAEDELLEGVYGTAGDLEGKGEISITDLVRMAKDVAEIEEIQ